MSELLTQIERLIQEQIIGQNTGRLTMEYGGLPCIVKNKNPVGDAIESWFGAWLNSNQIPWNPPNNTQQYPDITLSDGSNLEVKAFNSEAKPSFDIANFDSFIRSLWQGNVQRLHTPHLIFSYTMNETTGIINIDNYWIKQIWEISGPSTINFISMQKKQGRPHNIRPKNWSGNRSTLFQNPRDFVCALYRAEMHFRVENEPQEWYGYNWFERINQHYVTKYGENL